MTINAQPTTTQYVQICFVQQWDHSFRRVRPFYMLVAEAGSDSSAGFYTLRRYNNDKPEQNAGAVKFKDTGKTGANMLNYFSTISEGLNYMAALGWNMVLAYTEVRHDRDEVTLTGVTYPDDNDRRGSPRPYFVLKKGNDEQIQLAVILF
jgi:hypothetical protein